MSVSWDVAEWESSISVLDRQIGREVAIKTLTQGFKDDDNLLARFYEEGRRTGRLKHPNIVTVYDLGDEDGIPYIVMEHVEGDSLEKLIRSAQSQLSMADRLGVLEGGLSGSWLCPSQ